jgi:hypothetical protein
MHYYYNLVFIPVYMNMKKKNHTKLVLQLPEYFAGWPFDCQDATPQKDFTTWHIATNMWHHS